MSRLSGLTDVGLVGLVVGLVGGVIGDVVAVGFVVGFVGVVVGVVGVVGVRRLREWRAPTRLRTVPAPTSLRWIRGLLPGDEGTAWWAEVVSCLAETLDLDKRRLYVRSYRRKAPQLIWTSWTEHLRASRQRELL